MKILTNIFVSLFFSGYFKVWPGTFGSLISIIILYPLIKFNIISLLYLVFIFIIIFFLSLFFIEKFSAYTNSKDSKIIVIDEFLGIFLIMIFYNIIFINNDFLTLFLIFIIFRFFDILKIYPANLIDQKMKNALGVVLDDLIAAIYTIITLYVLNVFS